MKRFEVAGFSQVRPAVRGGGSAVRIFTSPSGCSFGRGAVFLHLPSTYGALRSVCCHRQS